MHASALLEVKNIPAAVISYVGMVDLPVGRTFQVGNTVAFGFGPQPFVARPSWYACPASCTPRLRAGFSRRRVPPLHCPTHIASAHRRAKRFVQHPP